MADVDSMHQPVYRHPEVLEIIFEGMGRWEKDSFAARVKTASVIFDCGYEIERMKKRPKSAPKAPLNRHLFDTFST